MSRLETAILYATVAHQGQIDEDGQPHIVHSLEVMFSVKRAYEEGASILKGYTLETLMIAAVLHDVPEDTTHTIDDIRKEFGDQVADIVDGVTRRVGIEGIGWVWDARRSAAKIKETYRDFIYRSRENPASCFLKIQDLLVNLGRCHSISPKKAKWREKLEYKYGIALRVLTALEPVTWEQVSWTFSGDKYTIADPNGKKIEITESEFKKHMAAKA